MQLSRTFGVIFCLLAACNPGRGDDGAWVSTSPDELESGATLSDPDVTLTVTAGDGDGASLGSGWEPVADGVWRLDLGDEQTAWAAHGSAGRDWITERFENEYEALVLSQVEPDAELESMFEERLDVLDREAEGAGAPPPPSTTCTLTASTGRVTGGVYGKGVASATASTSLYVYGYAKASGKSISASGSATTTYLSATATKYGTSSCSSQGYAQGCGWYVVNNRSGC